MTEPPSALHCPYISSAPDRSRPTYTGLPAVMTSAESKGDHDYNVRLVTHTGGALSVAPVAMTVPFMTEELYRAMRPAELQEIQRTGRAGLSTILDPRKQSLKWITGSRNYALEHAADMARDTMIVRYDLAKNYWRRTISRCILDG